MLQMLLFSSDRLYSLIAKKRTAPEMAAMRYIRAPTEYAPIREATIPMAWNTRGSTSSILPITFPPVIKDSPTLGADR